MRGGAGWVAGLLGLAAGMGLARAETQEKRVDPVKLLLKSDGQLTPSCARPSGEWMPTRLEGLSYELACEPTALPGRYVYALKVFNAYPHPLSFSVGLSHPGGKVAARMASVASCAVQADLASFVLPTPCGLPVSVEVKDEVAGLR